MRASIIVRQICRVVADKVHAARVAALLGAVDALLRGGRLALTALGRQLASTAQPKHRIKRIDRLLGNSRMHGEVRLWYAALAQRLLAGNRRPIILLDWTQVVGRHQALVAATPFLGRAIPIYAEVHPLAKLGSRQVQRTFLARLATVIPPKVTPIIVADAGFRTPFIRELQERRWNFVIRLRGRGVLTRYSHSIRIRSPRVPYSKVFAQAGDQPRSLGDWMPHARGQWRTFTRIVLGARPNPARKARRREGHYERRALEPWLLATSLERDVPGRIVALYAMRMQIEETFRDTKSARLGWALEHAGSRDENRQAVLLLIGCLALAATLLTGSAVEASGCARRFQANSVRDRRVQSLFHLGIYVLGLGEHVPLLIRDVLRERVHIAKFKRSWIQLCLPSTTLRSGKLI